LAATGVVLAKAAGWDAVPLVVRSYGGDGLRFTELAEKVDADVVLVGSRGLGGAHAILGSVSDMVVHYTPRPVLVVPHPLLTAEHAALAEGPVVVGLDGSAGAQEALATAARLFPDRRRLPVSVEDGHAPSDSASADATTVRIPMPGGHAGTGRAVAAGLAEYASREAAAVLVVGSRGRSAVREILLGSVAMATLHHAHRPVLVVSNPGPTGDGPSVEH
jgi:nucleotide-binding universal stress UspA family protein